MRDPLLVRCREAIRDVTREFERLADRDGPGIQAVPKRLAFKQFGHNEWRAGLSADVVHGEDIGLVERGGCAGFLLGSTEAIDVGRKCCGEDFDRGIASESRIARKLHLAHAASAEGGHDLWTGRDGCRERGPQSGADYTGRTCERGPGSIGPRANALQRRVLRSACETLKRMLTVLI